MRDRIISIISTSVVLTLILSMSAGAVLGLIGGITSQESLRGLGLLLFGLPIVVTLFVLIPIVMCTGNAEFEKEYGDCTW